MPRQTVPRSENLLLVTVDCLRADHVGCYGYDRPTTPNLDRLATDAWRFEHARASGIPTYYSFPAIHASRPPLALGRDTVGLAPEEPTLATTLAQAGYANAAFTAGNPYLTRRDHYDQGFDTFVDFLTGEVTPQDVLSAAPEGRSLRHRVESTVLELARPLPWVRSAIDELRFQVWTRRRRREAPPLVVLRRYPAADEVAARALTWIDRVEEPFFLWLHFMDPHHPYYPPPEARELLGIEPCDSGRAHNLNALWCREGLPQRRYQRIREEMVDLYDAGIRWVDHQLGRVVEALQARGLWDSTWLAFTGDHGEEFLEHGGRYHSPFHLHPELTHVPLVVRPPETASASTTGPIDTPVGLIDLAPTLLSRLGVEPPTSFTGRDRLDPGETEAPGSVVITEVVDGRRNPWRPGTESGHRLLAAELDGYKLVVRFATGEETLYHLEQDPEERQPLPQDAGPEVRTRLLAALRQHLEASHRGRGEDSALRGRLEVLRRRW